MEVDHNGQVLNYDFKDSYTPKILDKYDTKNICIKPSVLGLMIMLFVI